MSDEAIQPVSATIANAAASKGLRLEMNEDESTGIQSEQEGSDVSSQLQAWRQVHAHLIRAVTTAREAIAAKKCQRRFWMEEICGNLDEDGMLLPTSVWNRPGKAAASKSSTTRKRKGNSGAASSTKKKKTDEDEEEGTGKIKSAPKSTDRKRQKLKIRLAIHNSDASDDEGDDDEEKSDESDEDQGEATEAITKEEIDEATNEEHATPHVPTKKLILDEEQEAHEDEDEDDDVTDEDLVKTTRTEIKEHHEGEESGNEHYGTTSPTSRHDRGPRPHYGYAPRSQHEYHQEYHGPDRSSRRWSGPPPHPYMHASEYHHGSPPPPPYDYPPSYHPPAHYGVPPSAAHHPGDHYGYPPPHPHYPPASGYARDHHGAAVGDSDEESDGGPTF